MLLVERGLAESRQKAQALVLAGQVFSGERRVEKSGATMDVDAPLELRGGMPYLSRGGLKLVSALDAFEYDPRGKACADFGASTGGFTDVLLQRGAARCYAIDVGYGQLHSKLRQDPRVIVMERTNARHLTSLPEPIELVVIDASFIGVDKLLPAAIAIGAGHFDVIAMVKPQFQVGRDKVGTGGVVRDPELRSQAVDAVVLDAEALGLTLRGRADSAVLGPKGNQETFLWLRR